MRRRAKLLGVAWHEGTRYPRSMKYAGGASHHLQAMPVDADPARDSNNP
jgi:hypothetical protein